MSRISCDGEWRAGGRFPIRIMSKLEFVPGTDYRTKLEISEGGSAIDHADKSRARQRIQFIVAGSTLACRCVLCCTLSLRDRGAVRI